MVCVENAFLNFLPIFVLFIHSYASPQKISELTKHYSEFVVHPIYMKKIETEEVEDEDAEPEPEEEKKDDEDLDVEEEEKEKPKKMKTVTTETWEELNTRQALWTREADAITDDEYQSFWHVLNGDEFSNASHWVHFNAEGNINFKSLLYLPSEVPPELKTGHMEHFKSSVRLYVHKVLISDTFDLMPRYLSFIKGEFFDSMAPGRCCYIIFWPRLTGVFYFLLQVLLTVTIFL